ncbi:MULTISPECIES: hypothetical protein [Bacillota]|jgi:hypothetical protein|uniref:Uncharacterized protein n=2 Tax=Amedibacillus TaxID=2749846 RepID=A0A7G9GP04_9FIRM|nr:MULTISPECIES: hypothetical protein [Bacillota]QNM12536.1 hypothetical protein H9Q80_00840 [[Eubacterium] hominis]MCH4284155.1 hypothetical protein [Amedibacillus hominis]RGB57591.1 hypothetical protein DW271_04595 [Absiella sp. AM22-9]RGB62303.1 hypothetical protein DW120_04335 [Absiella sp. AM10-20]RGB67705.1 hypothetical protein DW113_05570 [Absiella sp. AM09-45]
MKKLAVVLESAGNFRFQTIENEHVFLLKTKRTSELETTVDSLLDTYEEVIALTDLQDYYEANKHLINDFNGRFMIMKLNDEKEIHEALTFMSSYTKQELKCGEQSMIFHVAKRQQERA